MKIKFALLAVLAFSLFSCKKESDKCASVTCYNDGVCLDGDCQCPPQWEGINCKEEKYPTRITVQSLRIDKLPDGFHDYYIKADTSGLSNVVRVTGTIYDAGPNSQPVFNITTPFSAQSTQLFFLVEEMPGGDEKYISSFSVKTWEYGTNFKNEWPFMDALLFPVEGVAISKFEWQ